MPSMSFAWLNISNSRISNKGLEMITSNGAGRHVLIFAQHFIGDVQVGADVLDVVLIVELLQ